MSWRPGTAARARSLQITEALPSLTEDVRARQRRYVTAMVIRTLCVVAMVVCWNTVRPLAFAALVGGVLIPYLAVGAAQGGRRPAPGKALYVAAPAAGPEEPPAPTKVLLPTLILPPEDRGDGRGEGRAEGPSGRGRAEDHREAA
ncbi:DUF3099 domain-containing protein [Streptomyces sp. NPDC097619]|uniref:DUF3099 domain-containing protein n=1 Tax=Streptomyces sp. NPDC097619 TaxID=3157228 RepID=UPI0033271D20